MIATVFVGLAVVGLAFGGTVFFFPGLILFVAAHVGARASTCG